jgi:hypothetical protein
MTPGKYNPKFYQGDTWQLTISLKDSNGAAFDLNGYSVTSQLRELPGSVDAAIDFTCNVADPATGVIEMIAAPSDTDDVVAGKYAWDLQIEHTGTGDIYTVLTGTATVTAEVTRPTP